MADEIRGLNEEALARIVAAAIQAANKLNPLEEKKLQEELAAQKRRDQAAIQLAKIEEESMRNRKSGCSHSRHPMAMGKLGGHAAPKGKGEWTTGGQMHDDDTATMVCTRCSWTWHWKPTLQERQYIEQNGMMGMAPPDESRLIKQDEAVA
jgi:hypothetical protein